MKFRHARSITSAVVAVGLLLTGCSSDGDPDPSSSPAADEGAAAIGELDTCAKVIAGYIVQMP
ncbi:MAG: hypothetical protein HN760_02790, partial [Microbacteriaceae bacterium]|nr:hypothetical protein [Microbacteriaceae bacterium]